MFRFYSFSIFALSPTALGWCVDFLCVKSLYGESLLVTSLCICHMNAGLGANPIEQVCVSERDCRHMLAYGLPANVQ